MELFFRKIGEGQPLVFLHGVFGSSDNLFTVSKAIADAGYAVYTLDARNHGLSPRSEKFNYEVMADDLNDFLIQNKLENAIIMGHSMGGKTVIAFSQKYSNFSKLIIIDIAPRFYPTHHEHIINGLAALNLNTLQNRKEAEATFSSFVEDLGERQFILKNLFRTENGGFDWRINVPVISDNMYLIGEEINLEKTVEQATLVIRGSESSYVSDEDFRNFKNKYPNATLVTIQGANHWVHATKPLEFVNSITDFLK
jgi:esterase